VLLPVYPESAFVSIIIAPDFPFVANSGVNIQVLTGHLGLVAAWILIRDLCGAPRSTLKEHFCADDSNVKILTVVMDRFTGLP
jgi:hypothetical protein